jgi:tRNA U34 5-carboxymethylaminomethyl modifying enzyme MnmG/GidA
MLQKMIWTKKFWNKPKRQDGYIEKERNNADKLLRLEDVKIPENFDYEKSNRCL